MKLSIKYPLVQLIILLFFVLSITLVIFIYLQMNRLGEQRVLMDNLNHNIILLRDELSLMSYKPQQPTAAYYDLNERITILDHIISRLNKAEFRSSRSTDEYKALLVSLDSLWQDITLWELDPLAKELRDLDPLAGYYTLSSYGMKASLSTLRQSDDQVLYNNIHDIIILIERLQPRINSDFAQLFSMTASSLDNAINQYNRSMITNGIIIVVIMFVLSLVLSWLLSRSIGINIGYLDNAMNQIAAGNFHVNVKSISNDEFRDISSSFNTLTEMLWFRLDSLKDIMRDVGQAVENESSSEELYSLILELAIDSTGADSAVIMIYNEEDNDLVMGRQMGYFPPPMDIPKSIRMKRDTMKEWFDVSHIPLNDNILGESFQNGASLFIHDNSQQRVLNHNLEKDSINYISSAIFLSLKTTGKKLGIIGLAKTTEGALFSDLDFTYMKSYANFVTITLDNFDKYQELIKKHEINREIEVAAEIQSTLLPDRMPPMKGMKIAAFSHAAKGVSGDYYDVFPLDSQRTAVIICDVSGKGIPASLFMVMFRTVLRTLSTADKNAAEILTTVNREISGNFQSGTFATASLLIIDQKDHSISYSNGAHHPLYIYRRDKGNFVKFDTEGLPMGIDIQSNYGHKYIKANSGDYLFLFTDGLTEARNDKGEELGTGRLLKYAAQYIDKSPDRMKELIMELISKFEGKAGQHDDETFLAIKIA